MVVEHALNQEAEAGGALSLKPVWSTEGGLGQTERATQRNTKKPVSLALSNVPLFLKFQWCESLR